MMRVCVFTAAVVGAVVAAPVAVQSDVEQVHIAQGGPAGERLPLFFCTAKRVRSVSLERRADERLDLARTCVGVDVDVEVGLTVGRLVNFRPSAP